ncbi:S9 family peptidase [Spongiactinospora sp. TRM90649]|uniref:S9 family peptidase n=1 Tax=Spongiactinospora sp. TRM90649 TaxID=3031114 RepID=UPI0023F73F19|nr:S9 family peptidase [Spongiactinospora sp. TRM90649]MDF5757955.1 S9 family peptidase [Spongiactinospora sp. TRM90649]
MTDFRDVFKDIRDYVQVPRFAGLRLSPDGTRLAGVVQALNPDGRSYGTALWDIPLTPEGEPRRLTRSAKGEAGAEFTGAGDLLFVSPRPDPTVKEGDDTEASALWLLPAGGGEARRIAARAGSVGAVRAGGGTVVFAADVLPGPEAGDAERRRARKEAGVSGVLYDSHPVRFWDHDLGPGEQRLFAAALGGETLAEIRDLTPEPGRALDDGAFAVTPDGTAVVTTWALPRPGGERRVDLVAIPVDGGERRVLASAEGYDFIGPVEVSPDGRHVACVRETHDRVGRDGRDHRVPMSILWVVDLATGEGAAPGGELWPAAIAWAPDSRAIYLAADHGGRRPVFRVPLDGGEVERVTASDSSYQQICPAPDGRALYAVRSGVAEAPVPVRLFLADGREEVLPSPAPALRLPGTLTEVTATADDGAPVRGWLVLPEGASAANPAPLLLWIHGGPLASWNDWSWRWNPWIMAEHGYAVLLPDPCLSTGYGEAMIRRGWRDWGPRTQADLLAVTDAALERPDLDAARTAVMGGSFGGYMANWIAGHTRRFKAIVTHAALWHLEQFLGTTDAPHYWRRELGTPGGETLRRLSPHLSLEQITTPMLVIHGDRDYRVPVGEALRLWWDLQRSSVESKFLYFPDENHWVLKPGNIVAWYETVLAFLAQHVLGEDWRAPESLS